MKKSLLLSSFIMLFTLVANAQNPEVKFETKVYDFGTIQEDGGVVATSFKFVNEGDVPLLINAVSASCGCATPEWTREPVSPKGKGVIKVSYNPKGRPGVFRKSIVVKSNSFEQPVVLQIKGEVVRSKK